MGLWFWWYISIGNASHKKTFSSKKLALLLRLLDLERGKLSFEIGDDPVLLLQLLLQDHHNVSNCFLLRLERQLRGPVQS